MKLAEGLVCSVRLGAAELVGLVVPKAEINKVVFVEATEEVTLRQVLELVHIIVFVVFALDRATLHSKRVAGLVLLHLEVCERRTIYLTRIPNLEFVDKLNIREVVLILLAALNDV